MLPTEIVDPEILYKAIKPLEHFWKDGYPSSAAFKDSKGLSVDRDGGRPKQVIIENLQARFETKAVVSVLAGECREIETYPVSKPLEDNIYHAEIHRSTTEVSLSSSLAKKLRDLVKIESLE